MEEKEDWKKYLPHRHHNEDLDRDTISDVIGFLVLVIIFETGFIIGLIFYIYFVLL